MDYGSVIYSSARKSYLKVLESIQCTGIRLATGAFRTTPLESLCCEAGISPLRIRRNKLLLNYMTRTTSQPDHPNYTLFANEEQLAYYERRPTITRPVGVRAKELCESLNIIQTQKIPLRVCEFPPWIISQPKCHLECAQSGKRETNIDLLKQTFYGIINKYPTSHVIYTDGSKMETGVASAIYISGNTYSWSLPSSSSIFMAELYAIWQALRYCGHWNQQKYLICSDSLSALQALNNRFTNDPMIQQILATLHWLKQISKEVYFVWCPGHIGINGNEKADAAARIAAEQGTPEDIAIRPEDVKKYSEVIMEKMWQMEWDNNIGKLKAVKQKVTRWLLPPQLSRRQSVALTRLRHGHTRVTSMFLLKGDPRPQCAKCNVVLTVEHIIKECENYRNVRQTLNISGTLTDILSNNELEVKKIMKYLNETGLFYQI